MDTEIWISYSFHMSWNTSILLLFFNHLKREEKILSLQAVQHTGGKLSVGHSGGTLTPGLRSSKVLQDISNSGLCSTGSKKTLQF